MPTFTDPLRSEEWQALVEIDSSGASHVVLEREGIRLHSPKEVPAVDELTEEALRELFLMSYREIWFENELWQVRWEEQPDQECWTLFESTSGTRRCLTVQYLFPYVRGSDLCDALRQAEAMD
jgi:hypothetical protein